MSFNVIFGYLLGHLGSIFQPNGYNSQYSTLVGILKTIFTMLGHFLLTIRGKRGCRESTTFQSGANSFLEGGPSEDAQWRRFQEQHAVLSKEQEKQRGQRVERDSRGVERGTPIQGRAVSRELEESEREPWEEERTQRERRGSWQSLDDFGIEQRSRGEDQLEAKQISV